MSFVVVCVLSLVALGVVAAIASALSKGGTDEPVNTAHDCSTCSAVADGSCKIGCLLEDKKRDKDNKSACL